MIKQQKNTGELREEVPPWGFIRWFHRRFCCLRGAYSTKNNRERETQSFKGDVKQDTPADCGVEKGDIHDGERKDVPENSMPLIIMATPIRQQGPQIDTYKKRVCSGGKQPKEEKTSYGKRNPRLVTCWSVVKRSGRA